MLVDNGDLAARPALPRLSAAAHAEAPSPLCEERGFVRGDRDAFSASEQGRTLALPLRRPSRRVLTGGLSDVIGRRTVLAAAGLLNLAAFLLQGLGTTPWVLTCGMPSWGRAEPCPAGRPRPGVSEATSGLVLPLSVPLLLAAAIAIAFVLYVLTALAATGYGLVYLGLGSAGPSENDLLHRRVTSAGRATALSVQSLALQLVGALSGLLIGVLPPGPIPWLLGGAVLLTGALLWIHRGQPASATGTATAQVSPSPSADAPPRV